MHIMGSPQRILLVDDYADALEMWALYLRALGYDVATAADGLRALDIATTWHPDVIVMDLELPGLSGFDAARRLRADPHTSNIPLIAATGFSHATQLGPGREAGFDVVVVKPCQPDDLVAQIEDLLHPGTSDTSEWHSTSTASEGRDTDEPRPPLAAKDPDRKS